MSVPAACHHVACVFVSVAAPPSDHSTAWIAVAAAAVGGLVGVLGQWVVLRTTGKRELRAERRDAYVEFLSVADRGIRVAEDGATLLTRIEEARQHVKEANARLNELLSRKGTDAPVVSAEELDQVNSDLSESKQNAKEVRRDLKRALAEVDEFLVGMDRGLVRMQLVSSDRLRGKGVHLRNGIDKRVYGKISSADLRRRRSNFAASAHLDLTGSGSTAWLRRRLRYLPEP